MNIHEKIAILRSAKESALFRGHKSKLVSYKNHHMHFECENCHMTMMINFEPKPNETDVSGEMVALNCTGKVYYAVNLNPVGYMPESEPYEGLETIEEILSAIFDCIYWYNYDGYDKNCAEFPTRKEIEDGLKLAIETNTLEHETIGYIGNGNYCVFVYKDHEYEYRQSK